MDRSSKADSDTVYVVLLKARTTIMDEEVRRTESKDTRSSAGQNHVQVNVNPQM